MIEKKFSTLLVTTLASSKAFRKPLLKFIDDRIYRSMVEDGTDAPHAVKLRKYELVSAMLYSFLRNYDRKNISIDVAGRMAGTLIDGMAGHNSAKEAREAYEAEYGISPPNLIVLSPTKACNLKCKGCYSSSKPSTNNKLDYDVVDRIVSEAHDILGNRFITISGGEPFLYHSKGKTLFDIWEKYNDIYFQVYTNGTLITDEVAKKLAKLGNVTPAISVEGYEEETDWRRGEGTFQKILESFANLRKAGVPFGISVTSTNRNAEILLEDGFYDYYFQKEGATYMWQFQLMPIGRASSGSMMLSPEQRMALYSKWRDIITRKNYFVADFWNSGVVSEGCIAYGKGGGYFYINWDGNIMPCVFVPYYVDNVHELFNSGKTIADALFSDFFKNGRSWQEDFKHSEGGVPHNWLMPCSIRDHYENFVENILTPEALPENEAAGDALASPGYSSMMKRFDEKLSKLSDPIWKDEYISAEPRLAQIPGQGRN